MDCPARSKTCSYSGKEHFMKRCKTINKAKNYLTVKHVDSITKINYDFNNDCDDLLGVHAVNCDHRIIKVALLVEGLIYRCN